VSSGQNDERLRVESPPELKEIGLDPADLRWVIVGDEEMGHLEPIDERALLAHAPFVAKAGNQARFREQSNRSSFACVDDDRIMTVLVEKEVDHAVIACTRVLKNTFLTADGERCF